MTMPYHKELLRSSVSLRFREFFVFRNKVKGVMTLLCQFEKMIYPSGTGAADATSFMIALYRPCEKLKDSSGNTITQIKAVGYCLPTASNMRYEMRGHWRKDPKYGIQYDVEGYEEQIIPTREGIVAYLSSGQIKGIGPKMAERIYDAFGNMALEVLDKKPEMLLTISGISQNKLKKICDSYLANRGARDVVAFLSPHGITPNRAVKLYKEYGEQTMDIVKNHPYKLCEMVGVGFKTADKIAMSMGIDRLSTERVDEGMFLRNKKNHAGERVPWYYCSLHENYNSSYCIKKAVKKQDVEDIALKLIRTQIKLFTDARELLAALNKKESSKTKFRIYSDQIRGVKKQIDRYVSLKASLYEEFANGTLSQNDYISMGQEYAAKADELHIFLAELEKECQKYNPSFAASGSWAELIEQYKDVDTLTAEMVDAFIDEMILYNNGHVEVKFKFRNELDEVIHLAAIRQREVERYAM